jgi:hypothetical protein
MGWSTRRRLLAVGAVALLALVGACSDDDDSGGSGDSDNGDDVTAGDPGTLEFQLTDVPFTFDYPANFAPVEPDKLPTGYFAIIGIDPINFIDVRLTATEELSDERIRDEIGGALDTDTTDVLEESTTERGDVTFITFEVSDTAQAEPTISRLNFVRAGGQTWELGCQSDLGGHDVIDEACDQMLDTFEIIEE